jgi:hypothetical protein
VKETEAMSESTCISTCTAPHREALAEGLLIRGHAVHRARAVVVQVAYESKVLKPGNHYLIGSRLKPGAFKLRVNFILTLHCPTGRIAVSCRMHASTASLTTRARTASHTAV